MENKIQKLMKYYKENPDDFADDAEKLDDYNGYLGNERRHPMDEIGKIYDDADPIEILRRTFYGEFNPYRNYFYVDAYGNFISTDKRDYRDFLDDECMQDIIDASPNLSLSKGALAIIDGQE